MHENNFHFYPEKQSQIMSKPIYSKDSNLGSIKLRILDLEAFTLVL